MTTYLRSLSTLSESLKDSTLKEVEAICLENSTKTFTKPDEKKEFLDLWVHTYAENFSNTFYIVFHEEKIVGYITVCPDSLKDMKLFEYAAYDLFKDLYVNYPAHLHINFKTTGQGKGLGSKAMSFLKEELARVGVEKLHIVTGSTSRNVSYYEKNGFRVLDSRNLKGSSLVFMGIKL